MGAIGHGDYLLACLFFPHTMLIWAAFSQTESLANWFAAVFIFGSAIVQFGLYGLALDIAVRRAAEQYTRNWIVGAHILSAVIVFIMWETGN